MRNPNGGIEDLDRMKNYAWIALNLGYPLNSWSTIIQRAKNNNIKIVLWHHVRNNQHVKDLCAQAKAFNGVIVDAEKEFDNGFVSEDVIVEQTLGMDACISTEPWLYNSINWAKFKKLHFHLQLFPQENPNPLSPHHFPRDCRANAYTRGAQRVSLMYGIHTLSVNDFVLEAPPFAVYTADDCNGNYQQWESRFKIANPDAPKYSGPLYGPSTFGKSKKYKMVPNIKRALHDLGFGSFWNPDQYYNRSLEQALKYFQLMYGISTTGQFGKGTYDQLSTLYSVTPGEGYAFS